MPITRSVSSWYGTNIDPASITSATSSSSGATLLTPSASTNTSDTSSTSLYAATSSDISSLLSSGVLLSSTTFASSVLSTTSPFSSYTSTPISSSSSTAWLSSSASASPTYSGTSGIDDSSTATASTGTSPAASTSASSGSSGGGSAPQTKEVVGGVFGGIAGVALLIGLAFVILRMKKRGWCHLRLGGDDEGPGAASKALPAAGGGGGGGEGEGSGAYGTMQQRSAPQAVAASLAAIAGKRSSRDRAGSGTENAERGFVRVSGRKLPPVLQYGGDGYTDPRNSQMSEASASVYRDSIAVFDQPNATRLALGSPMRPESGIMTMQPGPAKTPVTSQAPRHIDSPTLPRSSTFPSTDALGRTLESEGFSRDAIGRTLAVHDFSRDGAGSRDSRGSHASRGSTRFTEHVT